MAKEWFWILGVWAFVVTEIVTFIFAHRFRKIEARWQQLRSEKDEAIMTRLDHLTELVKGDCQLNMVTAKVLIKDPRAKDVVFFPSVTTAPEEWTSKSPKEILEDVNKIAEEFFPSEVECTVGDIDDLGKGVLTQGYELPKKGDEYIDLSKKPEGVADITGLLKTEDTETGRGGVLTECINCGKTHRVQALFCCDECEAAFDNEEDCADVNRPE